MPVMTVRGPIDKEDLGVTLTHEHLFVDVSFIYEEPEKEEYKKISGEKLKLENLYLLKKHPGFIKDNLILDNPEIMKEELKKFKVAGGKTIVDQSTIGIRRQTEDIKRISEDLDLNIIIATGYYLENFLPQEIINADKKELLKNIVNEIEYGISDTGIKPGIIGELGIGPIIGKWEKKLLTAASEAQKETGLPISVHIQAVPAIDGFTGSLNGLDVLKILEDSGSDLKKVAICHSDAQIDLKYIKDIIKTGAFAGFDHIGKDFYYENTGFIMDRDIDRVRAIKKLSELGLENRVLISRDTCLKTDLIKFGGLGFGYILETIIPMMEMIGISKNKIETMMIDNPKNFLNIDQKYL